MKEYKKKKNIYATPLRSKATLNKINVLKLFCWDMIYLFLTLFHKILGSLIIDLKPSRKKKRKKREKLGGRVLGFRSQVCQPSGFGKVIFSPLYFWLSHL